MEKKSGSARRIGIDFGTTNSGAGMYEQGRIQETLGRDKNPLPSLIAFNQGDYLFGPDAIDALQRKDDGSLPILGLKLRLGLSDELRVGAEKFNTEELATRYLKFLLGRLFGKSDYPKNLEVVIGTPVKFPASHRRALKNAVSAAKIRKVHFVYEPTAAVYYALEQNFALEKKNFPRGPVAVIDWGGGTVDVTIVKCIDSFQGDDCVQGIEDLNVNAREDGLGGVDMDKELLRTALASSEEAQAKFDAQDRSIKNAILHSVERGKKEYLDESGKGELGHHANFWDPKISREFRDYFQLTPELIDSCVKKFSDRVSRLAVDVTKSAGFSVEDIDHVLLIGGPCQSPAVRRHLKKIWPGAKELTVEHRQSATVRGCTMLAERGFKLALAADVVVRQFDDSKHAVLSRGGIFDHAKTAFKNVPFKYRVVDFSAPMAVLEIGYVGSQGGYEPLETLSVPVAHVRDDKDNSVRPYDIDLRVTLNELLYISASLAGGIDDGRGFRQVLERAELSRIPFILIPRTGDGEEE